MPRRITCGIPLHASNFATPLSLRHSASAAPQNQLHLAECTCRKSCWKFCDGGMRCATLGWCTKSLDSKLFLLIAPLSIFYFFFSVCVYNLWVITNMILGIVLGIITDKSLITTKRLIVHLQMSLVEKQPPWKIESFIC